MKIRRIYKAPAPLRRQSREVWVQFVGAPYAEPQGIPDHVPVSKIGKWLEENCDRPVLGWEEIKGQKRDDAPVPPVHDGGAGSMWG